MRSGTCVAVLGLILAGTSTSADTEIHRCLLEDGTFSFQETPCPEADVRVDANSESGENGTSADAFDFVNPFDEPASSQPPAEPALPEPVSQDRTECEKLSRDAIDAIDLEMRGNAYTKEEGEAYLADLLILTQQLRACKQL